MSMPTSLFPTDDTVGMITDLYELTMAGGYFSLRHNPQATFELFVRALPQNRHYLLFAGLEQVIHYLQNLRFGDQQIDWLKEQDVFEHVDPEFFNFLREFRFTGQLHALPEGTVIFANEPILRLTGSLLETQILETYLLTAVNFQTLVASKAARICHASEGRTVIDFGTRRAHGPQAGLLAARASFIGGCGGTSNVRAAEVLGIPMVGTQAHSWIMSFDSEQQSFEAYAKVYRRATTCLIDTYDTLGGAARAAKLGPLLKGVRLDSGDLVQLSKQVRRILDRAGLEQVKIIASSDLNEYTIKEMLDRGAAIDIFGVGTDMVTSKDAPALGIVYKLVEIARGARGVEPVIKLSTDKGSVGGAKQVYRQYVEGVMAGDIISLADERCEGQALLRAVIQGGQLVAKLPTLSEIRDRAAQQLGQLPAGLLELRGSPYYRVQYSPGLARQQQALCASYAGGSADEVMGVEESAGDV